MADIKTVLRELSVILGYILSKYKLKFIEDFIDVKTYVDFIRKYCKNVSEHNSEIKKIEELPSLIIHKSIIEDCLQLVKLLIINRKIRYAILDDVEQIVVLVEDGGLATAHFNDEFMVVNWYSRKIQKNINDDNIDKKVWEYLDNGRRSWENFYSKKEVDDEIIIFMLQKLYGEEFEFEKDDEVECFCSDDIKKFLSKNNFD